MSQLTTYELELLRDIAAEPFGLYSCLSINPSVAAAAATARLLELQLMRRLDTGQGICYDVAPAGRLLLEIREPNE